MHGANHRTGLERSPNGSWDLKDQGWFSTGNRRNESRGPKCIASKLCWYLEPSKSNQRTGRWWNEEKIGGRKR